MTAPNTELDDLDDFVHEGELPEDCIVISDDPQAATIMRRYRAVQRKIAKNLEVAEQETDRINAWERSVNAPLEATARFLAQGLEAYMAFVRERSNGKVKSISLPAGKIGSTATSTKWEVANKAAFLQWAKESGRQDLIKVKEEPEGITALKQALAADDEYAVDPTTGDTVPGLTIVKPEQPFTVKITTN